MSNLDFPQLLTFHASQNKNFEDFEIMVEKFDGPVKLIQVPDMILKNPLSYNALQSAFHDAIILKNLGLKDFYELFFYSLRLLNLSERKNNLKANRKETENFFSYQFKSFISLVTKISNDAHLKGNKNSDLILFENSKSLILIEFAANIPLGTVKDTNKKKTIYGHLNRLLLDYSKRKVEVNRLDKEKTETTTITVGQCWFIYYGTHENKINETDIKNIFKENKYQEMNMIFVDYDFENNKYDIKKKFLNQKVEDEKPNPKDEKEDENKEDGEDGEYKEEGEEGEEEEDKEEQGDLAQGKEEKKRNIKKQKVESRNLIISQEISKPIPKEEVEEKIEEEDIKEVSINVSKKIPTERDEENNQRNQRLMKKENKKENKKKGKTLFTT